jgi:hypothetical protein
MYSRNTSFVFFKCGICNGFTDCYMPKRLFMKIHPRSIILIACFPFLFKLKSSLMKKLLLLLGVCFLSLLLQTNVQAQNVFSGEPVQWVGRPNGYSTTPYGSDYRTTVYRKVSTTVSNPSDGRAQWSTTINVQSSGGDIAPDNMPGGGGAGWLLISGPSGNRFGNKWNFNGVGQGALNAVNAVVKQSGGQDMGLDMSTAGRYTFNMRDAGYVNTEFYVGYTSNAPVTVSRTSQTFSGGQAVINITTGATPSSGENVYVRYRIGTNDFSASTSVVQASGSGTSWSASIPSLSCGSTYYYYVYTSTRTLSQITVDGESDRSLAVLRYDDNSANNYSFLVSPSTAAVISGNASICSGISTNLQVAITGGASPYSVVYNINGGSPATVNSYTSGANIAVSPTINTTYTIVSVTGANGCAGTGNSGSAVVGIKTNVALASATATATPICSAATTTLTYSGLTGTNASVTWYDGAGGTGGTHGTGTPSGAVGPGTYYARATGDCGSPVEIQVIVGSNVNVSITSASASPAGPLCSGQTTTLSANGVSGTNAVVTWYTGPGGTGVNLGTGTSLPGQGANTYYARVTGDCGAAQEQSVTVGSIGNTFTGTGNWTDNARWSCGAPPSSGDAVTIGAGANATLNTNFIVSGSLTMAATSTLTVNPTRTLSVDVAATANFNSQSVTFQSDATGTASLGQVNGTLSGATNVTVERYIPNNGFRSWRLLSVPTFGNGQTIKQAWQENQAPLANGNPGFGTQITGPGLNVAASQALGFDNAGSTSSLLSWNGTGWTGQTTTLQAIAGQKAWFLYIRGERSKGVTGLTSDASATTLRTNGTVYTGDQVNTIGASATALIGNVYPSAIDFTGLTRTGGVSNTFYIWDSKKLNGTSLGAYQTFSGTNGFLCLLAGGSYTVGQPNTTIESGQGFLVKSTTSGTLTLKESAKISGTNGNLGLRPSTQKSKIDSRLYNANNEMLDANVVVFDAAYSKSVDTDDAIKFGNPGTNFAIETASTILAVEGTQPPADKDAVQFRMWSLQPQNYKLELTATNMVAEGLTATLEDAYLKTSTPMDLSAATSVNFTVDANAGSSDANRFRIVFSKAKPVVTDTKQGYTIAPNPVENGIINLQFKNQPAGKYGIRIMSTGGQTQKVVTITHAGGSSNQQVALPSTLAGGTYQLEIIAPNKTSILKTVLVNRK